MPLLAGAPWRSNPAECRAQGLVVSEHGELVPFQGEPEVPDGQVGTQQLAVEGAVPGLSVGELLGEESQGLPSAPDPLLQGGAYVGGGGIGHNGQWSPGVGVRQSDDSYQALLGGGESLPHGAP